jgi:hypothetical protein
LLGEGGRILRNQSQLLVQILRRGRKEKKENEGRKGEKIIGTELVSITNKKQENRRRQTKTRKIDERKRNVG